MIRVEFVLPPRPPRPEPADAPRPPSPARGSGSDASIGRSSNWRAVSTADPIATSVPPPRTQSASFFHPASPTPYAQAHSLSLRSGLRPLTIVARLVPSGSTMVSNCAERSLSKSDETIAWWLNPYCSNTHFSQPAGMCWPRQRPMRVPGFNRYVPAIGARSHDAGPCPRHLAEIRPDSADTGTIHVPAATCAAARDRDLRRLELGHRDERGVRDGSIRYILRDCRNLCRHGHGSSSSSVASNGFSI
jgi:hypothetical protein